MTDQTIPTKKVLTCSAQVFVDTDKVTAFNFISSGRKLSSWLKTSGKIAGCSQVDILKGPYDHVGARRLVTFKDHSSAIEQLLTFNPSSNYAYQITDFTGSVKKLTDKAYGQCWFDTVNNKTRITWDYTFTYKNLFARLILSMILTFSYKRFMQNALNRAKIKIEEQAGS